MYMEPRLKIKKKIAAYVTNYGYFMDGKIFYRYQQPDSEFRPDVKKLLYSLALKTLSETELFYFLDELAFAAKILETTPHP